MMNHLMTRRRLTSVLQQCIMADMDMVDSHSKRRENSAPRSFARKALAYDAIEPELIAKLREITQRVGALVEDARLRALIEVYVSQINGCAYCVDLHTRDALAHGESVQRLVGLAAWRESVLFDEREVAALAWADALTLPSLLTNGACAPARLRRCAARMLRMSPLRGDQSVATPTSSGRFASRFVANTASPSPLARAGELGGLLFADSGSSRLPGPRLPWTRTHAFIG
jgi:AhpD family alkylhydroperoxidase